MHLIITVYVIGNLNPIGVVQADVSAQDQPEVVVQADVSAQGLEARWRERGKQPCKLENYP